jgi:nitroimidazol reductase NimA-like FMN-containing flavoprotein (pyridoxamine 5'-phosphate oxidase superfamily)
MESLENRVRNEKSGKAMRKPERELKDQETINALLYRSQVGRIATVNRNGFPVIKPVNFVYWGGKVYVHSSTRGEKISDIRRGSCVCFEIDDPVAYVATRGGACAAGYYYRSVIVKGKAGLVKEQDKKMAILERLMDKYQPEGGFGEIEERILKKTAVIEIVIEELTAKEKLG